MINVPPKEITVPISLTWLEKSTVVTYEDSTDVLLIKSILKNLDVSFECASLLGDKRVLTTFASKEK